MNSLADSDSIFRYHRNMILFHGSQSSTALGWRDRESQVIRFKALAEIAGLTNCSVLDAGCGYGDLFTFLDQLYTNLTYTGIEQIPELFDEAVSRFTNQQQVNFIQGNFNTFNIPVTDYVFASGSLNYKSTTNNYIFKAILKLYESCRLGVAFNLLSHIEPNGLLIAYDPGTIVKYCESLCNRVVIKNDYTDGDFTVFMYR